LIGSTVYRVEGKYAIAARMLDLRRNRIVAEGPEEACQAFGFARSLADGALEGSVLSEALDAEVLTAMKVLARARELEPKSVPERLDFYATTLKKLREETRPGSKVTFTAPDGKEQVVVRAGKGGTLRIAEITEGLRKAMDESDVKFEMLKAESFDGSRLGQAALELETLFGPVLKSPTDYRPQMAVEESSEDLLFADLPPSSRSGCDARVPD